MKTITLFLISIIASLPVLSQNEVKWYSIEEAFELTKKNPKKIMVDVYTDWCTWCKVMDTMTFSNNIIAEYLNKNFYPVKFNAEQKTDVILNGKSYRFVPSGRRGYNELAAELLNGQLGYPSVVFLDENTNMIQPVQGYIKAKPFHQILRFIGDDAYKNTKWEDYQASFVSPIE